MRVTVTAEHNAAVTLKACCRVIPVALILTGYGCDAYRPPPSPVSPSPTPVQNQDPAPLIRQDFYPPGELWRLSTTIVSLEGGVCFWRAPVGNKFDKWTMSVDRNGSQVRFVYDVNNPHDNLLFAGAVKNDHSFTAATASFHSFWACSGGVTLSSSVVGSFSPDGRTLSGRERLTYRVDAGGELTITFDWNATRIDESAAR